MLNFTCKAFDSLSLAELYELMALRQQVFVVEQDCPYLDADGLDQQSWHLMGYEPGGPMLAYARLLPEGLAYSDYTSIGRVVTHTSSRSKGYGKQLMHRAIDEIIERFGATPIKISAQCYLIKFYESFGFQAVGEGYMEDGIPHIAMLRRGR